MLTGVALLGALATGLIGTSRTEAMIGRNAVEQAQAQLLVDGAVRLAIARLADRTAEPSTGAVQLIAVEGVAVAVSVQEAGGLVDLNTAVPALLTRLFAALGFPGDAAVRATAAIVARRAQRPFQLVDELQAVTPLDAAALGALRPYLTVQSRQAGIDPARAPAALLPLLAGDAREVAPGLRAASVGDVFLIRARLAEPGALPVERETVVRLTGIGADPVWYHDWRDGR